MEIIRPEIKLIWFGTADEGKKLVIGTGIGDLITIVADDKDESLWFEVQVGDKIAQIPLEKIREAIESALGEVHSESWYENNVYPDKDT